jgi:fluoroquinolone resistance protein
MDQPAYYNQTFETTNYTGQAVRGREFDACTFKSCDFSNSVFPNNKFIDCTFEGCNLSMMKLTGSYLNNAAFSNCKMLGVNFSECDNLLFTVAFKACILDYSSFMGKKMTQTKFVKSSLKEVTFSLANLSGSVFDEADLAGAVFNQTDLSSANFVNAFNYSIDPELNQVKHAVFSAGSLQGLLHKYQVKIV